jgi:tetratricopeptide (TPR) repeat protein
MGMRTIGTRWGAAGLMAAVLLTGCGQDYATRGREAYQQGFYEVAVSCFEIALREQPGDARLRYDYAVALANTVRRDEAIDHFRALIADPELRSRAVRRLVRLLADRARLAEIEARGGSDEEKRKNAAREARERREQAVQILREAVAQHRGRGDETVDLELDRAYAELLRELFHIVREDFASSHRQRLGSNGAQEIGFWFDRVIHVSDERYSRRGCSSRTGRAVWPSATSAASRPRRPRRARCCGSPSRGRRRSAPALRAPSTSGSSWASTA